MKRREFLGTGILLPSFGLCELSTYFGFIPSALLLTKNEYGIKFFSLANSDEVMGRSVDGERKGFAWIDPSKAISVQTESWGVVGSLFGRVLFKQALVCGKLNSFLSATNGSIFEPPAYAPDIQLKRGNLMLFNRCQESSFDPKNWFGANLVDTLTE